jgi:putative oxidoreductase
MLRRLISSTIIENNRVHLTLLLLRVSLGAMMLTHGWPKFQKMLNGNFSFADPLGIGETLSLILAVLAEFIGSIGLILGIFSRLNAFLLAVTMFVAGFIQHWDDPFPKKEKALLYLVGFIVLMVMGAGKHSLDDRLTN